ncbi:MAG: OmpA family protein, partial [Bacteroidota bacterium]
FRRGSDEMVPESFGELDAVVKLMEENPKLEIELGGHTDNRGNPAANVQLSEARVNTVKAYLVEAGIAAARIQGKGYGGAQPISENTTEELRAKNRRVEMKIIRNDD